MVATNASLLQLPDETGILPSAPITPHTPMAQSNHVWFGMKLTPEQKKKIKLLAEREGTSAKEALMRLVEQALATEPLEVEAGSFLDGIEHLIGSVEGPRDLSTNPRYMEGFGK